MDEVTVPWKLPDIAESEVSDNSSTPFSVQIKVRKTKETLSVLIRDILCAWGGFLSN